MGRALPRGRRLQQRHFETPDFRGEYIALWVSHRYSARLGKL
jgi:hypothetical protein